MAISVRFQIGGHDAAAWTGGNPVLLDREYAAEEDTGKFKLGDGSTAWNSLPYITFWSSFARLDGAVGDNAALAAALSGKQGSDALLTSIAGLTFGADSFIYGTGSDTAAAGTITAFGRSLVDDADAVAARTTLGLKRTFVSGRWYVPEGIFVRAAGGAFGSNQMRGFRGYIRDAVTIDQLGVHITTLAASGNFQIAIYAEDASTLAPTGAPLYSSASITTGATGAIADTGPSLALAQGFYWFFVLADASAATVVFVVTGATGLGYTQSAGASSLANAIGASASVTGQVKNHSFGTWPTLTGNFTTDSFTETLGSSVPVIAFTPA